MSRYDVILGKKIKKIKNSEKIYVKFSDKLSINIQKFKPKENDLFFISVPDMSEAQIDDLTKYLEKFNCAFVIINDEIKVQKVDLNGVKALKIETSLPGTEKLKELIWSNITKNSSHYRTAVSRNYSF